MTSLTISIISIISPEKLGVGFAIWTKRVFEKSYKRKGNQIGFPFFYLMEFEDLRFEFVGSSD